jgi:hypothetical protein
VALDGPQVPVADRLVLQSLNTDVVAGRDRCSSREGREPRRADNRKTAV